MPCFYLDPVNPSVNALWSDNTQAYSKMAIEKLAQDLIDILQALFGRFSGVRPCELSTSFGQSR
jgi:hypothetical protein